MRFPPHFARRLLPALVFGLACTAVQAQSIWMCVDEQGGRTFTNTRGAAKNCTAVETQPVASVPVPRSAQRPQASAPSSSPANYPRVDGATQKSRDSDRRRILEDELRGEEDRLTRVRSELAAAEGRSDAARSQRLREDAARADANVQSLRRELALLARQ
jgi:hypothetical protein